MARIFCLLLFRYKRKIKLHFKVPKDYEIVDYFKDEIIFDMYLDNFEIRYLLRELLSFIINYNELKNYTLKPYKIECPEIEDFFYTIKEDDNSVKKIFNPKTNPYK